MPILTTADRLRNGIAISLLLLLFLMPYSTFLFQVLRHLFEVSGHPLSGFLIQATVGWKEGLMVLGLVGFGLLWIIGKKFPFQITYLDIYLCLFALFGLLIGGLTAHKLSSVVFGFRYDFSLFIYYFLARSVRIPRLDLVEIMRKIALLSIPVFIFGILQVFVLPLKFMENFGYSATETRITGNPLPPYHLVASGHFVRALSTFPGPNSLAMYAGTIFLLVLILGRRWFASPPLYYALVILSFATLVLTFSRAHLLSVVLAGAIALSFALYVKNMEQKGSRSYLWQWLSIGCILVLLFSWVSTIYIGGLYAGQKKTPLLSFVLHDDSSVIHKSVRLEAWEIIKQHPFGTGLGTSGLATTNTGGKIFNPESWYIQITQELGWLGLFLAIGLIAMVCRAFVVLEEDLHDGEDRELMYYLLAAFLATVFSANFLPSWFEVASIMWWVLFGIFVSDYLVSFPRQARSFPIHMSE